MKALSLMFGLLFFSTTAMAGNMTFQFVNPNFGGNPNNGPFLLSEANAQNSYKDPDAYDWGSDYKEPTALENLTSMLQSQMLGDLMGNVSQGKTGSLSTPDFNIEVENIGGKLVMHIIDKKNGGKSSTIEVGGLSFNDTLSY